MCYRWHLFASLVPRTWCFYRSGRSILFDILWGLTGFCDKRQACCFLSWNNLWIKKLMLSIIDWCIEVETMKAASKQARKEARKMEAFRKKWLMTNEYISINKKDRLNGMNYRWSLTHIYLRWHLFSHFLRHVSDWSSLNHSGRGPKSIYTRFLLLTSPIQHQHFDVRAPALRSSGSTSSKSSFLAREL